MRPIYDLNTAWADQIQTAQGEVSKMYEAAIAVVTDNKDPQKLGRVKVKIPILSEQDTSTWSPIVMMGAGKNRGWFFIPEVDDEVLVMFEHGDISRALVVGALWNPKDKPSDKNDDNKNNRRVIKSRKGHKVTFDDKDGDEKIVIEDGGGKAKLTFDSKNNKIIIEALDGDICMQCPQGEMKIVAKEAQLEAKENIEIHAGAAMAWGTDTQATIQAPQVTLSGLPVLINCGGAQMPQMPTADPKDVDDPYGS